MVPGLIFLVSSFVGTMVWYGMVWYGMVWYGGMVHTYVTPFIQYSWRCFIVNKIQFHCKNRVHKRVALLGKTHNGKENSKFVGRWFKIVWETNCNNCQSHFDLQKALDPSQLISSRINYLVTQLLTVSFASQFNVCLLSSKLFQSLLTYRSGINLFDSLHQTYIPKHIRGVKYRRKICTISSMKNVIYLVLMYYLNCTTIL